MKCPQCHAEISELSRNCPYCGHAVAPAQPAQTAYHPGASGATPYYYTAPAYGTTTSSAVKKGKSGGEIAAIVIAVIVSILSVFAAVIIFSIYTVRLASTVDSSGFDLDDFSSGYDGDYSEYGDFGDFGGFGDYGIDDFDDEDSWESFLEHYGSLFGDKSQAPAAAPAEEHNPVEFQDYLYSFSNGNVETTYTVELDEAYRGEAALKLLEGAKLPEISDQQEIYLAKFKLQITEQETEAYVTVAPSTNMIAYAWTEDGTSGQQYTTLININYKDNNKLIKKGEENGCWMAFIIDKTEERPILMWDKYEGEYFRYSKAAVANPAGLEAGSAVEQNDGTTSQ